MKKDDLFDLIGKVDDKYIAELYDDETAKASPAAHGGAWKRWGALAACLALVIAGGALWYAHGGGAAAPEQTQVISPTAVPASAMSEVILDVNPSILLTLTPEGAVDSVSGLNDDANALLQGMTLSGDGCAQAFSDIVSAMQEKGYITNMQNSMLLTVVDQDSDTAEQTRQKVVSSMEYACAGCGFEVSILSQVSDGVSCAGEAEEYGISVGKAALIDKIVSDTDKYDYGELAELNIHSLDQIMDYIGTQGVERAGRVAGALADKVSSDLNIGELVPDEALDLAVALSGAYDELCRVNPMLDVSTYTGYDFDLARGTASDGSAVWTITAKNANDSSLPSVSISLSKNVGLVGDVFRLGAAAVSDSVKLACDIFGLPGLLGGRLK